MKHALVFAGGELGDVKIDRLPEFDYVIAADSGLHSAVTVGITVDIAIGDFDSVDAQLLDSAESTGTIVERHAPMKDATDLELSIDHALAGGADSVTVVGGGGGRVDHLFANILLLTQARYAQMKMSALIGRTTITVVRNRSVLRGKPGDLISLNALERAEGVTTEGLLFPLNNEPLVPASTRGVSNEFADSEATVTVEKGFLLAVQPGEMGIHYFAAHGTDRP